MLNRVIRFAGIIMGYLVGSTIIVWMPLLVRFLLQEVDDGTRVTAIFGTVVTMIPVTFLWWAFIIYGEESTLYRIWALTKPADDASSPKDPQQSDWR